MAYEEVAEVVRYGDYKYSDIMEMLPFEFDSYVFIWLTQIKKEEQSRK